MSLRRTLVALAFLAALSAGCKGRKSLTPAEMNALVDKKLADEAVAVRQLDALMALPPLMDSIPPTVSAKSFGPLTGMACLSDAPHWTRENVLCVTMESLKLGPMTEALYFPRPSDLDWNAACRLLKEVRAAKAAGGNYGKLVLKFGQAAKIGYVVVVRGTWTPPKVKSAKSFEAGGFVGDAQVFAIGDRIEHLGGVPLAATNSRELTFSDKPGGQDDDAARALNSDLSLQVYRHLCQQLARYGGVEIPSKFREEPVKKPGPPK